jgi:hypothetical protein
MLWGLLLKLPGLATGLLDFLNKKQDAALERFRIGDTNGKEVSIALIQAEIARQNAAGDFLRAAMSHPIWWFAWGLGVFPVMGYYAAIFWVSTFPFWGWTVLKAPADALEFAKLVVGSMFGIAGVSSVVAGVAHAWTTKRA